MLKIADSTCVPKTYLVRCAFSKTVYEITPEEIHAEVTEDGILFVCAWIHKKLVFAQACQSLHIKDESVVKAIAPPVKKLSAARAKIKEDAV